MNLYFSWLLLAVAISASPRDLVEDAKKYLLPGNVVPTHYSLTIYTHIENFRLGQEKTFQFEGYVNISILPVEDNVQEVIIHTYDIEIVSVALESSNNCSYTFYGVR